MASIHITSDSQEAFEARLENLCTDYEVAELVARAVVAHPELSAIAAKWATLHEDGSWSFHQPADWEAELKGADLETSRKNRAVLQALDAFVLAREAATAAYTAIPEPVSQGNKRGNLRQGRHSGNSIQRLNV